MKTIALGGKHAAGREMIVDDDMFDELSHRKWYLHADGYAVSKSGPTGKMYRAHRVVVGDGDDLGEVHHINWDKLDNRRENLLPIRKGSVAGRRLQAIATEQKTLRQISQTDSGTFAVRFRDVEGKQRHRTFDSITDALSFRNSVYDDLVRSLVNIIINEF